jgi:iron complex outermembrane receptor protein
VNDRKNTYNVRKEIEQTQTGLTWTKPLNDQQELYACSIWATDKLYNISRFLMELPPRSSPSCGVIDFERDYYGADFRWTGKEFYRILL